MKTNFKRLFALLLTLCMLASLMVPVAFAEDEAVTAPSANVAETYPIRLKDLNHTDPLTATGLDALMANTNASGVTTYKAPGLADKKLVNAYADGTLNWKFVATSNEAVYRSDRAWQVRVNKGWAAFQIRVENSGMYALNLASDKNTYDGWTNEANTWAGDISAYIIPAADFSVDAIDTLLTDEYSVGTVAMAADQSNVTFGKTRMELGEYVVVINNPVVTGLSIAELSLIGDAFEIAEIEKYTIAPVDSSVVSAEEAYAAGGIAAQFVNVTDNDGVTTYAYKTTSSGVSISKVDSATLYKNGALNWKWLFSSAGFNYRPAMNYQLRLDTDGLIAFQIKVPTAGKYALTLSTIIAGTYSADAYVLNVNDMPAGAAYADLAVAANSVGPATVTSAKCGVFDTKYYEAGEYIVILSNTSGANFPVSAIGLSQYAVDATTESDKVTGTVATYDFEIYELDRYAPMFTNADGSMANRSYTNRTLSALEGVYEYDVSINPILVNDYEAGLLNYKFVAVGNGCTNNVRGADKLGVRIQKIATTEAAAAWIAYEINVPTGGIYTVDLESEYSSNDAFSTYVLPADADIASSLTEENKAASFAAKAKNLGFSAQFAAGANIVVFQLPETTEKVTIYLSSITLSVLSDTVIYDFALPQNEAFMNAWYAANGGTETAIPASGPNMYKWEGTSATFNPYSAIADAYVSGDINWALGTSSGANLPVTNANEAKNFRVYETYLRCQIENEDPTLNYTSFHLNVANPGTYDVTVNYTKQSDSVKAYLFKSPVAYKEYADRLSADVLATYMTEENLVHGTANINAPAVNFTYTFEEAGEYVIAFTPVRTDKPNSMNLSSIVMEPVEINYVADGAGYATFDEAVANATESIVLLQNTQVGELVVPAGVSLDLNGYILYASSVDATAPGAQIIDAMDGKGLIRGDIEFAEDNAQLPLYDIDANGYKLFNVDVVSSATTGTGSNTKYWFKVNFANDAAFDLIGSNTELRIIAGMTYVKAEEAFDVVASADAAFTNAWAAKNTSYIVVTTTGEASGTGSTFELTPGVTANGVVISGDGMHKA